MDIKKAVSDFIVAHEVMNASHYTTSGYRVTLLAFADWLESTYSVIDTNDMHLSHLREWLSFLQKSTGRYGKPLADGTVHQYGLRLSAFCHWLEQEEIIEKPITTRFKLPSVERKFIPTFTQDDIQKMLEVCDEGSRFNSSVRKALTARNRAIISVMVDTGIRRSELAALRLCDVDRVSRVLLVHRKGNKWQQVPVSREGFKPLHDYLVKHRSVLAAIAGRTVALKEDGVFLTFMGETMSPAGISKLFERIAHRANIDDKKVSAHNCRRYMATTQLSMGRSPLDVQRQMGHTTLQMTNRYASLSIEQLQRSHEEFSPMRFRRSGPKVDPDESGYWDE